MHRASSQVLRLRVPFRIIGAVLETLCGSFENANFPLVFFALMWDAWALGKSYSSYYSFCGTS